MRPDGVLPILLSVRPATDDGSFTRAGEPVTVGVPFPKGVLPDSAKLRVRDARGSTVPVQSSTTERWSDGSVRWSLLHFAVNTDSTGTSSITLDTGGEDIGVATPIAVVARDNALQIDTGCLLLSFDAGSQSVTLQRPGQSPYRADVMLRASGGTVIRPTFSTPIVDVQGPLLTRIRVDGRVVVGAKPLNVRLVVDAYAALPCLAVSVALHNPARATHPGGIWELGDAGSVLFDALDVVFTAVSAEAMSASYSETRGGTMAPATGGVTIHQESSGGEHWNGRTHVAADGTIPPRFRGYSVESSGTRTMGLRATPVVTLGAGEQAISLAMRHFWENSPKSMTASACAIRLGVFPHASGGPPYELQGGERKRHDFYVCLGPDPVSGSTLDWIRSPLIVSAAPDWYARCDALPYLVPEGEAPAAEALIQAGLDGPSSFFAKREIADEYGWRDFGDLYADHEAPSPSGEFVSHYNNQYDCVYGFGRQFLRTGDRRWFGLMDALARHVADIDIYHTTEDKAGYNGGLFWHTYHYVDAGKSTHRSYPRAPRITGGGPSAEHDYAEGLALHYRMTGDPDSRAAVRELADWVVAMDDGRRTMFRWLDAGATGWASATASLDYQGPGRGAGNSITTLLTGARLFDEAAYVSKAEEIIRRCAHPEDRPDALNLLDAESRWSYTVFLQALGRYLALKEERGQRDANYRYALETLLTYARWMTEHEYCFLDRPENLEFPTETWAAQDLRKGEVFVLAWLRCAEEERARLQDRAEYFFTRPLETLQRFPTATSTRPLALLLSYSWSVPWMRLHAHAPRAAGHVTERFPRTSFEPQRFKAIRRAKRLAAAAFVLMLMLAAWVVWALMRA